MQRFCQCAVCGYHTVSHPTVMSKMLLPTELDTAMSPMPLRATITLVMRSGMDVPAAKMVRPMISSEMPMVSPTCEGGKERLRLKELRQTGKACDDGHQY